MDVRRRLTTQEWRQWGPEPLRYLEQCKQPQRKLGETGEQVTTGSWGTSVYRSLRYVIT